MKPLRRIILTSLGLLPFILPMDTAFGRDSVESDDLLTSAKEMPWRKSRFSLEAQTGSRSIATIDALVPFMGNDDFMVYANLMAKYGTGANNKNGTNLEGNAGLGFRRVNDSETAIYGAYAFYDYLNSVNDNTFTQVTVGAERLGLTWDFRVNAYLPVGQTKITKTIYEGGKIMIQDHNLIEYLKSSTETVSTGGDIEVGRTLGTNKLRAYVAAYSFGAGLTGGRLRAEFQLSDHFTATGMVQYDQDRGLQYLAGIRYSIGGAQASKSNSIYARMTAPVVRDLDIVTKETKVDDLKIENDRFWLVDVDAGPGGDGTIENPFGYIDQAIEAAPENAIIFIKGKDGSIKQVLDHVSLKEGQILWGGDKPLYWNFDKGVPVFSADQNSLLVHEGSGVRQSIGGDIIAANNTGIYNLNIVADDFTNDKTGVLIDNVSNVTIQDVNISGFNRAGTGASGITINGDSQNINIDNVTINDSQIGLLMRGGNVNFNNVVINNSISYGVRLEGGQLNAGDMVIHNSGVNGIYAKDTTLNANNIIITDTQQSIGFYANNATVNIANHLSIDNSAQWGLYMTDSNVKVGSVDVDHSNSFNGISQTGGDFEVFGDVNVNNTHGDGVYIAHTNSTNIHGLLTIDKSNGAGLVMYSSDVSIGDIKISNSDNQGLFQEQGNLHVLGDVSIDKSGVETSDEGDGLHHNVGIITTNANLTIDGHLSITESSATGFSIFGSTVNINSIDVSGSGKDGLYQEQGALTVVDGAKFSENGGDGISSNNAVINLLGKTITENNAFTGANFISSTVTLEDLTTQNNKRYGIFNQSSTITIQNINANQNPTGVFSTGGNLTINKGKIDKNEDYGVQAFYGNISINNTIISQNGLYGIYLNAINLGNFNNITVNNNQQYGMDITSGTVSIQNSHFEGNGMGTDITNATSYDDLYSAIRIGSNKSGRTSVSIENTDVVNNGAGIEVVSGNLSFNQMSGKRALIQGNNAYGVWVHNADANANRSNVRIYNTDIKNSRAIANIENSGSGIVSDAKADLYLENINISYNAAFGLQLLGGEIEGVNVTLDSNSTNIFMSQDEAGMASQLDLYQSRVTHATKADVTQTGGLLDLHDSYVDITE